MTSQMRNIDDRTLQQQFDREDRADAYRARRDAQTFTERDEEQRKQRVANRAFRARMSSEERLLAAAKQRERRANETPAERDIRRAKQREYNRAWRARKKAEKK